jgi:hypothetical protein
MGQLERELSIAQPACIQKKKKKKKKKRKRKKKKNKYALIVLSNEESNEF